MSSVLLDTGVFAMVLTDDPRLTSAAREALVAADRVVLSAISLYEIGQNVRFGKWPEMAPFAAALATQATGDDIDLLPLSPGVALEAALLDWDHRDPFDRMIACVARAEGLSLISPDAIFDALGLRRVWVT
jgi:PIN domain nuclease of toxin-antitoxin system